MKYSCFDDKSGTYAYFEDSKQLAINADLPVPNLPMAVAGIGVPSIEAGRSLPVFAKYTGRGWMPRGVIVKCGDQSSLSGFVEDTQSWIQGGGWKWVAAAGAVTLLVLLTKD